MALFVPPSNQPYAIDVKTNTSNEAVTAGEFWRVVAQVQNGGAFYIADEIALDSVGTDTFSNNNVSSSQTVISESSYTRHFAISYSLGSSSTLQIVFPSGNTHYTIGTGATTGQFNGILAAGARVTYTQSSNSSIVASATPVMNEANTAEFFVPAGTNLRVAGDAHYTVMKYKNLGT